jgi:putative transport protein
VNWFIQLLTTPSVPHDALVVSSTVAFGLTLGRIKVKGVGLGVAGTLFSGILLSHFGLRLEVPVLDFLRDFGLVLFVYAIGVQVGPGFLSTLRSQGLAWNLLAIGMILTGSALSIVLGMTFGAGIPASLGILAGATNNMPSLGAARQTLSSLPGWNADIGRTMTLSCATTYPFGIVGLLLAMILLRWIGRISVPEELQRFETASRVGSHPLSSVSLALENSNLFGRSIREIPGLMERGAVVTRRMRGSNVAIAHPEDVLARGDILHVVGKDDVVEDLAKIIGHPSEYDLRNVSGDLSASRIVVTRASVCGRTLEELQLTDRFGVTASRMERGDAILSAGPGARILFADRLLVVGPPESIEAAASALGNSERDSNHPQILPLFLGIMLGVLVGSVPLSIPGILMPVKLGLAGGPLVTSIVLARQRRIGPLDFYLPTAANIMLRELGVALFLSCVGLMSGDGFFECLRSGPGLEWMILGMLVTLVPVLATAAVGRFLLKIDYLSLCGLLAGASTCPPALAFASSMAACDAAAIASATVYPVTMLLRVATAQVLALFLG